MSKRFEINNNMNLDDKVETYELSCIVDNENKTFYFIVDSIANVESFVERLNELHEENKELKFQLDECRTHKLFSRRELEKENEQLKTTIQQLRTDNTKQKKLLNTTMKENEQLKCGNKNLKATLNDFINILNRLQSNPNNEQTLNVARDMLQNMGVDLE